jgi:spermidine synthase
VMALMGTLALLTLPAYNHTFDLMGWAMRAFTPTEGGYTGFNLVSQGIAMAIMLPTTFCAGMTLPLLTNSLLKRNAGERAIGAVYAANTLGAIVGTLAAIHLLMPLVGVKGVIVSGAAIHMAIGVSGLVLARSFTPALRIAFGTCCAAFAAVAIFGAKLDPLRMTAGVYRLGITSLPPSTNVMYLRDGKTATISLVEAEGAVTIATNGKPDAQVQMGDGRPSSDEITMLLAGALPLSLHSHPERVANIGFGSGLTSATMLMSERVKSLESIEIEPFMVQAARQGYLPRIKGVFEDPRSRIVFEDAKTFFAMTREPYDVIISEPSNPWVSGVATLFSDEFYARIVTYLKPDGLLVQWLQIYETDLSIMASIVGAMSEHFGAYAVYNVDDTNIMIVATRGAALPPHHGAPFDSPQLRAQLARVGIRSVDDIRLRRLGDQHTLGPLFASFRSPVNSDFFPFVDLNAPRMRFMKRNAIELPSLAFMPVPVLELVDKSVSRARTEALSAESRMTSDLLARQAVEIRDAVVSGKLAEVAAAVTSQITTLRASREQCLDPGVQRAWRGAVKTVADLTTPSLSADELKGMWSTIVTTDCYRSDSARNRPWADFLAAVAGRDASVIVQSGTPLLEGADPEFGGEREYLVTALAAAQLRLGNVGAAQTLLKQARESKNPAYHLALRQMLALVEQATDVRAADARH